MINRFYVYALIDPRDGSLFYVGKGSGQRVSQHVKAVRRGVKDCNDLKRAKIRQILDDGMVPFEFIVAHHLHEQEAVDIEYQLIMGLDGLTNIISRGWARSPAELERLEERRRERREPQEFLRAWRGIHPDVRDGLLNRGQRIRAQVSGVWEDITEITVLALRKVEARLLGEGMSQEDLYGRPHP